MLFKAILNISTLLRADSFQCLLTILLLCCSLQGVAQEYEYVPFPTEDAEWTRDYFHFVDCQDGLLSYCNSSSLHLEQNHVLINDTLYSELFNSSGIGGAFIREDMNRRVYLRGSAPLDNEILYYDFSLEVGDTLPVHPGVPSDTFVVGGIDTMEISGVIRKVFKVFDLNGVFTGTDIIEGIGSTTGLFLPYYGFESKTILTCYQHQGQFLFSHVYDELTVWYFENEYPEYEFCNPIIYSISDNTDHPKLILFPNPSQGSVIINSDAKFSAEIELFSASRVPVMSVVNKNDGRTSLSNIQPGIYIARITIDDKTSNQKLIVK